MTTPQPAGNGVFLSYASQDAEAARHICEALRAAGVEVWFDQNELVGGDAWDAKIRGQIASCALFVPIISANTQARLEGYFRLEWKLAAQRTHTMADEKTFLLPVVIDPTRDGEAKVPVEFKSVQWTRLPAGETTPRFCARVLGLLDGGKVSPTGDARALDGNASGEAPASLPRKRTRWPVSALIAMAAIAILASWQPWRDQAKPKEGSPAASSRAALPAASTPAGAVSTKSIAVLPFENRGAGNDDTFADGMHDEVITALAKIHDLTVISRMSVLAYRKTEGRNLRTIAGELGVATVLQGSVQRAGNRVKVIAQLVDARSDKHLWADSFTEDATDVFAIQAKLALAITTALKATFSAEERTLIARRPTENQEAYELYLQAKLLHARLIFSSPRAEWDRLIFLLERAVAADPAFAWTHAALSRAHAGLYWSGSLDPSPARREMARAALAAAQRLAPGEPETIVAEGRFAYACDTDFELARSRYAAALDRLPNDSDVLRGLATAQRRLGRFAEAADSFQRALVLNPADVSAADTLGDAYLVVGRFADVVSLRKTYAGGEPEFADLARNAAFAQFELDADRAAFVNRMRHLPRSGSDPFGGWVAYETAFFSGDLAGALQALADPRIIAVEGIGATVAEPPALYRAFMARLLGQRDIAARHAAEARAALLGGQWTPRQQRLVKLALVRAAAFAGEDAEAFRLASALRPELNGRDAIDETNILDCLADIYALLGRADDAFACLRKFQERGIVVLANQKRINPCWSQLKADPRFEEILQATKPR